MLAAPLAAPARCAARPMAVRSAVVLSGRGRGSGARVATVAVYALLLASFAPYAWPPERQPVLYRDGATLEQLQRQRQRREEERHLRELDRFLNGNLEDIEWAAASGD